MYTFEKRLLKRELSGNLRRLKVVDGLIDFASNDHLGLARSPELMSRTLLEKRTTTNYAGSTGSRLLTGNSTYAELLEKQIAEFHGYQTATLFNCGYMANVGLLSAVATNDDLIFFDAYIHASTHDGIRLSRAKAFPFKHNDPTHLKKRLKNASKTKNIFICVESIYSTDGSQAPLNEISSIAKKYHAHLIVDEAHSIGIYGKEGRGLIDSLNLTTDIFALVATFGKSLGVHGAAVLGGDLLKNTLINFSTPYIYTTALPFYSLAAIKCSYDLFPTFEIQRKNLQRLVDICSENKCSNSSTHIQSIKIKGNHRVQNIAQQLEKEGFDIRPLMSPTVQKGEESLRLCLHAFNTETELFSLLQFIDFYKGFYHE